MNGRRRARIAFDDLDGLLTRRRPDNPKLHAIEELDASVERFGFVAPVLVNDDDGLLLEGHGRLELLDTLRAGGAPPPLGVRVSPTGDWLVPTIHGVALAPEAAQGYMVAANRIVELGGWNEERLAEILRGLSEDGGLSGVGFSEADLARMLEGLAKTDPLRDPDEIVLDDVRLYVRRGQIWRLGSHRLICADATETRTLACLLAGRRADMAITDPPYNVDYGRHGGSSSRRQRVIANDCLPAEEWESFTREWAARLIGSVEGAIYVFMSCKEWPTVSRILGEVGGHWSDTIIWAKDQFVLGRADYQRQHEPIWYGWRERSRRQWLGGRGQGDVWSIPRPRASDLHPTMKPVALLEKAIANSSAPGARVLDPFVGSGSTLIACERLGRRCLAAEIEPRWVQTTIARWEAYAGRRAKLEERNDKWCNL